jgi:hypothetical protein
VHGPMAMGAFRLKEELRRKRVPVVLAPRHVGLSYEYSLGAAASWRVFDARSYLDFGAKREVDLHSNFRDFGGQLSTGIVF